MVDTATVVELLGAGDLVLTQTALQEGLQPDQILAKTRFSTISAGTEVAAYMGMPPLRPGKVYPRLVGYCNVAEVTEVGSDVAAIRPGDTVLTHQSHRSHFICREADVLAVVLSDPKLATTAYLYHLGYAALMKGALAPGHNVGVVGLGTLGLTTTALASRFGARVAVFSNQASSLELATAFGCWLASPKSDIAAKDIDQLTRGAGLDLIVNTSNSWNDWRLALTLARKGGTVVNLGFPGRGEPPPSYNPLDSSLVYDKQLTIAAAGFMPNLEASAQDIRFTMKRNIGFLLDLIARGDLSSDKLISETLPWHRISEAYENLARRRAGYLTATLDWTV